MLNTKYDMRYDNMIPFTYQRYVIKILSIYVRYTNKMTTNTLSGYCMSLGYFTSKQTIYNDMNVISKQNNTKQYVHAYELKDTRSVTAAQYKKTLFLL